MKGIIQQGEMASNDCRFLALKSFPFFGVWSQNGPGYVCFGMAQMYIREG